MQHPSRVHKSRHQRFRRRPADLEERLPFERLPFWLRAISSLPLPLWYAIGSFFAWIAEHVARHRRAIIDMQLAACFPDRDERWLRDTRRAFYRGFGQVSVEIIKAATISREEIDRRVRFVNAEAPRAALAAGQSIIVVTSHNCNWEWTLLKLCTEFGPIQAAYKPLKGRFGDRLMLTIRSRFGADMVAARRMLMRVLRYRGPPRIVAMVADQAPTSSAVRYFTRFMGLDTAFFLGPEAIARGAQASGLLSGHAPRAARLLQRRLRATVRGRRGFAARRTDRALRESRGVADPRKPAGLAVELPALEGAAGRRGQSEDREIGGDSRTRQAGIIANTVG